jgi:hypothetical protein
VPQAIDNNDLLSKGLTGRHVEITSSKVKANCGSSSLALVSSTLPTGTSTCTRCSSQSTLRDGHDDNLSITSVNHIQNRSRESVPVNYGVRLVNTNINGEPFYGENMDEPPIYMFDEELARSAQEPNAIISLEPLDSRRILNTPIIIDCQ